MRDDMFTVPPEMLKLLSIDRKNDLVKYCRALTISKSALASLVFRAAELGYTYDRKMFEYVPDFLKQGPGPPSRIGNSDGSFTPDGRKFVNRIVSIFDQRRVFIAHLFYTSTKWHIFYLDYRDIDDSDENHWKGGSHVHFVNYLWSNLTRQSAWDQLGGKSNKSLGEHIRFDSETTDTSVS